METGGILRSSYALVYTYLALEYTTLGVSSHFAFRIRKARSSLDGDESYMKMMNEYIYSVSKVWASFRKVGGF